MDPFLQLCSQHLKYQTFNERIVPEQMNNRFNPCHGINKKHQLKYSFFEVYYPSKVSAEYFVSVDRLHRSTKLSLLSIITRKSDFAIAVVENFPPGAYPSKRINLQCQVLKVEQIKLP